MNLAAKNLVLQDGAGNLLSGASVEVRSEEPGQPLVQVYADRDGEEPLGNPFVSADGRPRIHVEDGAYQIKVTFGALEHTWRYVGIGRAQESDVGNVEDHILDTSNPHGVTAAQVGALPVGAINSGERTVHDRGTISTGTQTPQPSDGALQKGVNNGAHTVAAPTALGFYVLTYTNGASAGTITVTGFDRVDDPEEALEHTVEASVVELAVYNDGVKKRIIVTLIEDAT